MSTLSRITVQEGKLFLREPSMVAFAVVFPTALLLVLGAVPALREPSEDFGGVRFVEVFAPSALILGVGVLALQHVPAIVANYRERGILRRISTTPVHPGLLLVAQLVVALLAAVASAVILILSAWLVLDVSPPQHPVGFAAAFLVGFAAVIAIGMVIAAWAPTPQLATGLSTLAYMVAMFAGGVFVPRFLLPEPLVRVGEYVPPGVQALLDAWSDAPAGVAGDPGVASAGPPELLHLGIMAAIAVALGSAAAKLFRWE
ncbi:ABC transporter permease [Natronosporangium hydrolyticum]|uniref:ABC transporter permease n=1 Tax=Natronosporangium hydrolyticum TaxID=2811111 RepID=A0A895YQB2_9ACTN|nr:ABC transporter permease [Natronosporangium hydrolyticum]